MEYMVITSSSKLEFEDKVNEAIKEGWTPQGGIGVTINTVGLSVEPILFQAMIKG